jgi:hypothetical protein
VAPVVHTPVKGFTGTVAGVNFADGAGETDDQAALQYFRSAGYEVADTVPPAGTPLTAEELERVAQNESARDDGAVPVDQSDILSGGDESEGDEPDESERPHPVQGSKAVWYEHLSKLKPDHGFDLEKVTRKELIAAVEAIESN